MHPSSLRKAPRDGLQNFGAVLWGIQKHDDIATLRARDQPLLVVVSCPESPFSQLGCGRTLTALLEMLRELFGSRLRFLRAVRHRNYEFALLLHLRIGHDVRRRQERMP